MSIKVAINGYGTIGKRVADAVDAQGRHGNHRRHQNPTVVRLRFGRSQGLPVVLHLRRCDRIAAFAEVGYTCHGGLSDLLAVADVVVDCSPGKVGAANKEAYLKAGVKYIFQGGEKHDMAGMSYTSSANHAQNLNALGNAWCPATRPGLSRTLVPLFEHCGSLTVECTMIRRAADPGDSKGSHQRHQTRSEGPVSSRARRDDGQAGN